MKDIKFISDDFSNLHDKTIYDLIDEKSAKDWRFLSKETYESNKGEWILIGSFCSLASITKNIELKKAVSEQFAQEISERYPF